MVAATIPTHRINHIALTGPSNETKMASTRTELTKERIVATAIDILESDGPTALSMRRLAAELGVSTMSTYHHVESKEGLIEAIAERMVAEVASPDPNAHWTEVLMSTARDFHTQTRAHPNVFAALMGPTRPAALMAKSGEVIAHLEQCGFTSSEALLVFRSVIRFLIGTAVHEGPNGPHHKSIEAADEQFEFGLTSMVNGIVSAFPNNP